MSVVQNWILLGNRGQDCVSSLSCFGRAGEKGGNFPKFGEKKKSIYCVTT